jgi:hypothetical protein
MCVMYPMNTMSHSSGLQDNWATRLTVGAPRGRDDGGLLEYAPHERLQQWLQRPALQRAAAGYGAQCIALAARAMAALGGRMTAWAQQLRMRAAGQQIG